MNTDRFMIGRTSQAHVAAFTEPKRTAYVYFDSSAGAELGAGVCEIPVGSSNQKHAHDEHDEVIFVIAGRIKFVFPDAEVVLSATEAIYIAKGLDHQIFNVGDEVAWHSFTFTSPLPADRIRNLYRDPK